MVTTLTKRGQTVVPAEIRRRFHIQSNAKLEWLASGDTISVIPMPEDLIKGARGIAKGSGLMQALREDRKRERERGR